VPGVPRNQSHLVARGPILGTTGAATLLYVQGEMVSTEAERQLEQVNAAAGERESSRYQSAGYRAKRVLLGPALRTSELIHERITKRVALAVFSSDPISSTAYATEEILIVLVPA